VGLRELGQQVTEARTRADLVRSELGVASGVSVATIADIERGSRPTRRSTLAALSTAVAAFSDDDPARQLAGWIEAASGELAAESSYPGQTERTAERRRQRANPRRATLERLLRRGEFRAVVDDLLSQADVAGPHEPTPPGGKGNIPKANGGADA